jgi:hypothetical protein
MYSLFNNAVTMQCQMVTIWLTGKHGEISSYALIKATEEKNPSQNS